MEYRCVLCICVYTLIRLHRRGWAKPFMTALQNATFQYFLFSFKCTVSVRAANVLCRCLVKHKPLKMWAGKRSLLEERAFSVEQNNFSLCIFLKERSFVFPSLFVLPFLSSLFFLLRTDYDVSAAKYFYDRGFRLCFVGCGTDAPPEWQQTAILGQDRDS